MLRFPKRSLTTFAAFTLLSSFSFAAIYACLPDLPTLPPAQDASEANTPAPIPFFGCGDSIIDTLDDGGITNETCDPGDASVAGCESCKFVCSGKISDSGHCYFFADPKATYADARNACANAAAHLVTFTSQREVDFVNELADGGAYWVGLSVNSILDFNYAPPPNVLEPGFPGESSSQKCDGCFAVVPDGSTKFPSHPTIDGGGVAFFLVSQDGRWLKVPSETPDKFLTICEREPVGQRLFYCGGPNCTTLTMTAGKKRYVLPQALVTEDQAAAACAPYGRLVLLDSNEEREQLVREVLAQFPLMRNPANNKVIPVEVWIGLSAYDGGVWHWDDDGGRPLPWGAGEPTTTGRAYLQINEEFDTQLARTSSDASTRAVVCERPPP